MKKYLKVSYLLNLLTILIFGFLFLDSFFYTGFSQKHFLINLKYFLILYLALIFIFYIFKKISISKKLIKINKFFFPIVFLISILFLYLEKSNYTNFVYTYFHLNQINFLYIPLISGFIFFLYNNQISKAKSYYLPPIIATCLSQYLSFNQNYDFYTSKYQIVLVINYFLWLIILLLFTSFFKKRYYSLVGFLSFFLIFNLINRLKIKILNQFFTINDFYLIKELKNFIPSVIKGINLKELLVILTILFLVIFLIFIFRNKSKTKNPSFKIRLLLFIISAFVLIFPTIFPIQFGKIIDKSKITIDLSNPIQICRNDGILFCFYYDFKNIRNIPPENYSQQTINQIYSDIKPENLTSEKLKSDNKINIVVILSEAFWDATKLPINILKIQSKILEAT